MKRRLGFLIGGALWPLLAGVPASGQTGPANLTNVRATDPGRLIGSLCRGTFWVPGSQAETGMGAFRFEFFERDGLLSVNQSSKFGLDAYNRAMSPALELETIGAAKSLEVDGNNVTVVGATGGKWNLELKTDGALKGTVDPRGVPGRENWSIARVDAKCTK